MSKSYSVAEARAHLPDILDDVEAGKEVHLTRRGRPVAVMLSPQRYEALRSERSSFGEPYARSLLTTHRRISGCYWRSRRFLPRSMGSFVREQEQQHAHDDQEQAEPQEATQPGRLMFIHWLKSPGDRPASGPPQHIKAPSATVRARS